MQAAGGRNDHGVLGITRGVKPNPSPISMHFIKNITCQKPPSGTDAF